MTHADAFMQAIIDAPDDDAPRLLFADWLEEQGDAERAEFIRLQITLTRNPPAFAPGPMWSRQRELLARHNKEWSASVRGVALSWSYERGFVEEIETTAAAFLDGAEELFRRAPIRRLRLYWQPGPALTASYIPRMADCKPMNQLQHLNLSANPLGSDGFQALLVAAPLTDLKSLYLTNCQIGDRGARALARSPLLRRLVSLDLSYNEIGPGGVRVIAEELECEPAQLRRLVLDGNPIGEAGRRAVLASRLLRMTTDLPPPERTGRGRTLNR